MNGLMRIEPFELALDGRRRETYYAYVERQNASQRITRRLLNSLRTTQSCCLFIAAAKKCRKSAGSSLTHARQCLVTYAHAII